MVDTYVDCLIEDLQGEKLDVVILGEFQDFVYGHPCLLITLKLVKELVCILHLRNTGKKVKQKFCL